MADPLFTLTELLRELPGIGPRQARRLAFWLARRERAWVEQLARTLTDARRSMRVCAVCQRVYADDGSERCALCGDTARDATFLMVVEKDVDLENVERTGAFKGRYFVLGGTASLLDAHPEQKIRLDALLGLLREPTSSVREVVLACSATTEGEDTAALVRERIDPIVRERGIRQSTLGRGLSTGTELEYVDEATMRNAFLHRTP